MSSIFAWTVGSLVVFLTCYAIGGGSLRDLLGWNTAYQNAEGSQ